MNKATPQRTVTVSVYGRTAEDAQVAYTFWSPSDGRTFNASPVCDLYQKHATNTLFLLDYQSTLNGWTISGVEPNPPGAPALETIRGPANMSVMTMFPDLKVPEIFNFYLVFKNTLTGAEVRFDPQEKNIPTVDGE